MLGITHFSKGSAGRDPVDRVTGSLAFSAVPRIVLAAAKRSEEQGGGRLLARVKSNIGPDGGGFAFDLKTVDLPTPVALLHELQTVGATVRAEGNHLRLIAPAPLPDELLSRVRDHRAELLAVLDDPAAALEAACTGLALSPTDVLAVLTPEERTEAEAGLLEPELLRAFAAGLKRPQHARTGRAATYLHPARAVRPVRQRVASDRLSGLGEQLPMAS